MFVTVDRDKFLAGPQDEVRRQRTGTPGQSGHRQGHMDREPASPRRGADRPLRTSVVRPLRAGANRPFHKGVIPPFFNLLLRISRILKNWLTDGSGPLNCAITVSANRCMEALASATGTVLKSTDGDVMSTPRTCLRSVAMVSASRPGVRTPAVLFWVWPAVPVNHILTIFWEFKASRWGWLPQFIRQIPPSVE